ncbi:checkpoint protein HUS1 [Calliphora vicina]|uniref:checkpoint protein HUS1 n=1 Tax=Calliphora vicina TaxID=7373 RepID=UPI00325AD208
MKFRALMQDPEYMKEFQNIILTLSKLTKECVIDISADKMYFIANEESGTTAPLVWVEIEAGLYFPEYELKLQDDRHPHIMLAISPANFSRALTHLRSNARTCKMNLINIQFSCLRIEIEVPSQSSNNITKTVHDVPVSVIPRSEWNFYEVPQKPKSKIILNVPSNRLMRGLIDKVKNLSPTIIFYATSNGEMNLVAETEMATITTHYKNLEIKEIDPSGRSGSSEHVEASCSVDCKKASLFFTALQVPTLELSCGIDDDRLIHMEVDVRQGIAIHSILPAVCI